MERPHQLAGVDVPGAHVARRAPGRILLRAAAGDDQVLVHVGGDLRPLLPGQPLHDLRRVQVDDAAVAERLGSARRSSRRASTACRRSCRRRSAAASRASPGQYSTPRVEGLPAAAGRPRPPCPSSGRAPRRGRRAWLIYITPLTTSGVVSLAAKPEPPRPRPRPPLERQRRRPAAAAGGRPGACDRPTPPAAGRRWRA